MSEYRNAGAARSTVSKVALAALLCAPMAPAVEAGVIGVTLRDEHGSALPGIRLGLAGGSGGEFQPRFLETDLAGKALFDEVPPGQYRVTRQERDLRFVRPEHNPFAPDPWITLAEGQPRAEVEWELWRGVEVYCRVNIRRGELRSAIVRFHEIDLGRDVELLLGDPPVGPIRLVPGRWTVSLEPIPGLLLETIEVDGIAVPGFDPLLDLEPLIPAVDVAFDYAAPAMLHGRVTFEGRDFPVGVVARLLEAGPWVETARQRGGSSYEQVHAGVRLDDGTYEMQLPDGLWEVQPSAVGLVASVPETRSVRIPPGGAERADFTVSGQDRQTSTLMVTVKSPDSQYTTGAVVEVWPLDPGERQEEPTRRLTPGRSMAMIHGLAAGDYVVAASAEGYAEGQTAVTGFGAREDEEPRHVEVLLQSGATLHAVITPDEEERAPTTAPRVSLRLKKSTEETGGIIREAATVARTLAPQVESDRSGHAWLRGLHPGEYELTAALEARSADLGFVRIRDEAELTETRVLEIVETETHEVELVVVPAASISGSLTCSDEGTLPGIVSFIALDARHNLELLGERQILEEAILRLDDLPLSGELRDRFRAGPLREGFYHVALRPAGHDRWTWALGTERAAAAATIQGVPGEPAELGVIELDCGPVLSLAPKVAGGQPLPDLRGTTPGGRVAQVTGRTTRGGKPFEVGRTVAEPFPGRVLLRGLPEGDAQLTVVLLNEYFLPQPRLEFSVDALLERGRTRTIEPIVPGIGGRLVVLDLAEGSGVRLTGPPGFRRLQPVVLGRAVFDSLPAGAYQVEVCADPQCKEVPGIPIPLQITVGRTLELSPTNP